MTNFGDNMDIDIGNGAGLMGALTELFPRIDEKLTNQIVLDQLQTPGSNNVKNIFTDALQQRVSTVLASKRKHQVPVHLPFKLADSSEEALLTDAYPEYKLEFNYTTSNPHALAANSRILEMRVLLDRAEYDREIVEQKLSTFGWDDYACDIGGNFYTHWSANRVGIHSCCPLISDYDDLRFNTRRDSIFKQIFNERTLTTWQREMANNIRDENNCEKTLYCTNLAEDCHRTARYGFMLHSNYDIPLRKLGDTMTNKNIQIVYGSFIFDTDILVNGTDGVLMPLGAYYQISTDKKKIRFGFKNDSSLTYSHRIDDYVAYTVVTVFFDSNYKNKYYLEMQENRLGIQFFKVTRSSCTTMREIAFNHRLWFANAEKKLVVKFFNMNEFAGTFRNRFGCVSFEETHFLKEESLVFEKDLVESGLAFALGCTEEKFRPMDVFNYLRTQNRRIIFGQRDVLNLTNKEDSIRLYKLASAIYLYAYVLKYDQGKLNQAVINNIKFVREIRSKNLFSKIVEIPEHEDLIVSTILPASWHRYWYKAAKGRAQTVDITQHIKFFEFDSAGTTCYSAKFNTLKYKFIDMYQKFTQFDVKILPFKVPDVVVNSLNIDLRGTLKRIIKNTYDLDVEFEPPSSDGKQRYIDEHCNDSISVRSPYVNSSACSVSSVSGATVKKSKFDWGCFMRANRRAERGVDASEYDGSISSGSVGSRGSFLTGFVRKSVGSVVTQVVEGIPAPRAPVFTAENIHTLKDIISCSQLRDFDEGQRINALLDLGSSIGNSLVIKIMDDITLTEEVLLASENYVVTAKSGSVYIHFRSECVAKLLSTLDEINAISIEMEKRLLVILYPGQRFESFVCDEVMPRVWSGIRILCATVEAKETGDPGDTVVFDGVEYRIVRCKGDGKCLFYALNSGGEDIDDLMRVLRDSRVEHELLIPEDLDDELNFRTWGGAQTIMAFSWIFNTPVVVHSLSGLPNFRISVGTGVADEHHLLYNGVHYDYLRPIGRVTSEVTGSLHTALTASQGSLAVYSALDSGNVAVESDQASLCAEPVGMSVDEAIKNEILCFLRTGAISEQEADETPVFQLVKGRLEESDCLFHFVKDWSQGNYAGFAADVMSDLGEEAVLNLGVARDSGELFFGKYFISHGNKFKNVLHIVSNRNICLLDLEKFLILLSELDVSLTFNVRLDTVAVCMGLWKHKPSEVFKVFDSFSFAHIRFRMFIEREDLFEKVASYNVAGSSASSMDSVELIKSGSNLLNEVFLYMNATLRKPESVGALYNSIKDVLPIEDSFPKQRDFYKWLSKHSDHFLLTSDGVESYVYIKGGVAKSSHVRGLVEGAKKIKEKADAIVERVVVVRDKVEDYFFDHPKVCQVYEEYKTMIPDLVKYSGNAQEYVNVMVTMHVLFRPLKFSGAVFAVLTIDDFQRHLDSILELYKIDLCHLSAHSEFDYLMLRLVPVGDEHQTSVGVLSRLNALMAHRNVCWYCKNGIRGSFGWDDVSGLYLDCLPSVDGKVTKVYSIVGGVPLVLFRKRVKSVDDDWDVEVKKVGNDVIYYLDVFWSTGGKIAESNVKSQVSSLLRRAAQDNVNTLCIDATNTTNYHILTNKLCRFLNIFVYLREETISPVRDDSRSFNPAYRLEETPADFINNSIREVCELNRVATDNILADLTPKLNRAKACLMGSKGLGNTMFTDPGFGILDIKKRRWVYKPRNLEEHYMAACDGTDLVVNTGEEKRGGFLETCEFSTTERYLAVSKSTKVFLNRIMLERCKGLDTEYFSANGVRFRLHLGVPGAGKSRTILERVDSGRREEIFAAWNPDDENSSLGDLILTTTREAAEDMRFKFAKSAKDMTNKVFERFVQRKVRTIDSVIIHGVTGSYTDVVWIDEALMKHAGDIFCVVALLGVKRVNLFGDQAQIPYVCRLSDVVTRKSSILDLPGIHKEEMSVSYRCPLDIMARFNYFDCYPFRTFATNSRTSSVRVVKISALSEIPRLSTSVPVLTYLQQEKSELIKAGFAKVHTVHEFQGNQASHVVLVRLSSKTYPVHKSVNHMVVAVSRHTHSFVYYTVADDDITKFLDEKPNSSLLAAAKISKGGYEIKHFSPVKTLKTYTESRVLRNIVERHGCSNVRPFKVDTTLESENLLFDIPFNLNEPKPCLRVLQEYYDSIFPRSCGTDNWFDYYNLELNDWVIQAGDFQIRDVLPVKMDYRTTLRPNLSTSIQRRVPNTVRQLVKAYADRNGNVPDYLGENNNWDLLHRGVERFERTFIGDMETYMQFSKERIEVNTRDMMQWLATQNGDMLQVLGRIEDDSPVFLRELNRYSYILKNTTKPVLDDSAASKIASPQTIAFHDKLVNSVFCPLVREMKHRLNFVLKKNFLIFSDMSIEEFTNELNMRFPPSMLNTYREATEIDFGKYDKSQGYLMRLVEDKLMERLGFPTELLPYWHWAHAYSQLVNLNLKFKADVQFQRKSGDAMTFFGNTIILMYVLAYVYDLDNTFAMFSGDDSYIFSTKVFANVESCNRFFLLFNLEAKLLRFAVPYFCSKFLIPVNDTSWIVVPDVVKLIIKLGRKDLVDWEHVEEYRISLRDLTKVFENANVNDLISDALYDRYGVTTGVDLVLRSILGFVSTRENFASLYYLEDGETLLIDPSRPSLDI